LRTLSSRVKFWKSLFDKVSIFPCCSNLWKIEPLYQPLDNWFVVARNHSSFKQGLWVHQDSAFTVDQW
jgi:hypothetical protein